MKFQHASQRLSGLVVPLSALRTESSPGCGEFPDLATVGELAASWGLALVQLLPVNDSGAQESPYFALSAFALNPIYIKISDLPELKGKAAAGLLAEARGLVDRFGGSERVPYGPLLAAKLELLRKVWDFAREADAREAAGARPAGDAELDAWIESNPWSRAYAAFVALKAANRELPWWEWKELRDPSEGDIARLWEGGPLLDELRFRSWLQMRAEGQFRSAAEGLASRGIALMGDIPILMNGDSADVWSRRRFFRLDLTAGAPPDMYAALGQNWGFPIYDWDALEREGYGFWRERLVEADKYYSCYRIDHVLGFFRIWSLSDRESTGAMGRFVPDIPVTRRELEELGFSAERLRWLSRPHVPSWRLVQAAGESAAKGAVFAALSRIGDEDLYLFKDSVLGEKDIEALPSISPAARDFLLSAWRDRVLYEFEPGSYSPTWSYRLASAWPTLWDAEREALEALVARKKAEAEALWGGTGRKLLGALKSFVPMLPCAEDLGAVPPCVPETLSDLGILGLRVLRWARRWDEAGQPYVPVGEYPELSVACPSVHDSTSLRGWWESEADREATWRMAAATLGRDLGPCPERLGPDEALALLEVVARSASRIAVYPIQDLVAMSESFRPDDPGSERVNVPGTVGGTNWSYRIPAGLSALLGDKRLASRAKALAKARSLGAGPKSR
jgi:4-alpha-glucanotransferase